MRRPHGLSLTAPLEFWELVSANTIKSADGLVWSLWFMSVSLNAVLRCWWLATPVTLVTALPTKFFQAPTACPVDRFRYATLRHTSSEDKKIDTLRHSPWQIIMYVHSVYCCARLPCPHNHSISVVLFQFIRTMLPHSRPYSGFDALSAVGDKTIKRGASWHVLHT